MLDGFVEGAQQHPSRQDAQGHVDVEDPAPAEELGEEAAEGGADDGGDGPDAGEVALHSGPFGDGVDVAGDGDGHGLHRSCAEPLQRAERDECGHAPGEPAEDRAEQKTVSLLTRKLSILLPLWIAGYRGGSLAYQPSL